MKKRENYNLEYCETDNCVCVYQTKNNIGRVGIILPNGKIRYDSGKIGKIPHYIYCEAIQLIK